MTEDELKKLFYPKGETYTRDEIAQMIGAAASGNQGPVTDFNFDPGAHLKGRYWTFADAGTYTHFLDADGDPIVIAPPDEGFMITQGTLYDTGTYFTGYYKPEPVPNIDTSNFVAKTDLGQSGIVNLFDKDNTINNSSIVSCSTGTNTGYMRTLNIVPVSPGQYCLSYDGVTSQRFTWYIGSTCQGELTPTTTFGNYRLWTVPAGATGVRWNVASIAANWGNKDTMMFVAGAVYPDTYRPYNSGLSIISINNTPIKNTDITPYDKSQTYSKTEVNGLVPAVSSEFVAGSAQLFDKNAADIALGKFVAYATGTLTTNASYNATGHIPVTAGLQYTMSFKHQMAWYNASKVYISGSNSSDTNKTQTAPAGAAFARCTVTIANWDTFTFAAGTAQLPYEPYVASYYKLLAVGPAKIAYTAPDSSYDPNVAFPSIIRALVGQQMNIYFDSWNLLPEYGAGTPSQFLFDVTCTKGSVTYRSFQFTPVTGDVGSYPLTINILDSYGNALYTVASTIVVIARSLPATVKNVLVLGDSTWMNDGVDAGGGVATKTLLDICTAIGGNVPVLFGQQGPSPVKNEARSGRTYTSFAAGATCYKVYFSGVTAFDISNLRQATYRYGASGTSNYLRLVERWVFNGDGTGYAIGYNDGSGAFAPPVSFPATMNKTTGSTGEAAPFPATLNVTGVDTLASFSILKDAAGLGALNITYYVETVLGKPAGTKIDVVSIDLGINDTSNPAADISVIINSAKLLVAAFKAHNSNIKIVICYPKSRSSDNFPTIRKKIRFTMQALRKALMTEFDANDANPNVFVAFSGIGMDRFYGYPVTQVSSGARLTDATQFFAGTQNDVHPSSFGNQQIGDSVSGTFIYALSLA